MEDGRAALQSRWTDPSLRFPEKSTHSAFFSLSLRFPARSYPLTLKDYENNSLRITITHKKIIELVPKQYWFGNSSTEITEYNSQNISVR